MNPFSSKRIAPLLLLLAPVLCAGWGRDGHKIASTIAEQHLTPEAKAAVIQLLGGQSLTPQPRKTRFRVVSKNSNDRKCLSCKASHFKARVV